MAEMPKIPTPDKLMEVASKQVEQSMSLINTQFSELSTALGLPSPPTLPKFAFPGLPKLPGMSGSSSGNPFPQLPQLPFFAAPAKKGEERITPTPTPEIGVREIIA